VPLISKDQIILMVKNKKLKIVPISTDKARTILILEIVQKMIKDIPFDKFQQSRHDPKFEKKLVNHREYLLELVDKINTYGWHKHEQKR